MGTPAERLAAFCAACAAKTVRVGYDAQRDARAYFGLVQETDVVSHIEGGHLQELLYVRSDPWRNNPKAATIPVVVDVYNFFLGEKYGYLAFHEVPWKSIWHVKSFKKNDDPNPRAGRSMFQALAKVGLLQLPGSTDKDTKR